MEPLRTSEDATVGAGTTASAAQSATAPANRLERPTAEASASARSTATVASATQSAEGDMLPVPGGEFTMGADDAGERDERPAHKVTLKPFLLDKTEVTNGKYLECVKAGACKPYSANAAHAMHYGAEELFRGANQPVVGVSWFDAKAYCAWRGKRLPREAEWERAARGDDNRKYPWGNDSPDPTRHGCFSGCKNGATMPVGSYPDGKGPYGHLDLGGNVWEWMEDMYDPIAYTRPTASRGEPGSCEQILQTLDSLRKNHQQGFTGSNPIPVECEHVLRGGAFNYAGPGLRVTNRVHHPGQFRILVAGFRCAKDAA